MKKSSMSIAPGVIVEKVGDDVVVMVPESTEVIRLSGDTAQLVRAIHDGLPVVPSEAVYELIDRGILVSHTGMSRRGLITAGAIGAGAGVAALAMPSVAAASSDPPRANWNAFSWAGGVSTSDITEIAGFASNLPADVTDGTWDLTISTVTTTPSTIQVSVTGGVFSFGSDGVPVSPSISVSGGDPDPSTLQGTLSKNGVSVPLTFTYIPPRT